MRDTIYRDDAIRIANGFCHPANIAKELERLPSAQPEIIRCRDCKHFAGEGMYCAWDIMVQYDHFYCYHAERRADYGRVRAERGTGEMEVGHGNR